MFSFCEKQVYLCHNCSNDVDPDLPVVPEEEHECHYAKSCESDVFLALCCTHQDHVKKNRSFQFGQDRPEVLIVVGVNSARSEDVCQVEHFLCPIIDLLGVGREHFWLGFIPISREELFVVGNVSSNAFVEAEIDVVSGNERDDYDRGVESQRSTKQGARNIN